MQEIEAARAQVEAQLAQLLANPNRSELASDIALLQAQLSQLDGMRAEAGTANLAQLSGLQVGVSVAVGATHNLTTSIASSAAVDSFQSVMAMSHEEMAALEQENWHQTEQFQQFEADMFTRIDALAAVNGIDVSKYHERQRQLQTEYDEAKARGDLVGMLEADALRASNLRTGLESVGASEAEIEAAREQEQAAQKRFLDQTAIDARREAEAKGMSADAAEQHVSSTVARADAKLNDRLAGIDAELGLDGAIEAPKFEVAEVAQNAPPSPIPSNQTQEPALQV